MREKIGSMLIGMLKGDNLKLNKTALKNDFMVVGIELMVICGYISGCKIATRDSSYFLNDDYRDNGGKDLDNDLL